MATLPVQLVLFINARHYRTFNLQEHSTFTVTHLKTHLAKDFCVPTQYIQFTLVSGLFIRDHNSLYNLRASDGNHASLDVDLHESYSSSHLAGKIISFKYRENPQPNAVYETSEDGIQNIDINYHSRQPESPTPQSSRPLPDLSERRLNLTREQKIALEDPFSISSRSCFEDDNEDEQQVDENSDSTSDVDDDLYSDDGEMPLAENRRTWPADPSQLQYEHLIALASVTPFHHPKREIPMHSWLLRSTFQRKLHAEMRQLCLKSAVKKVAQSEERETLIVQPAENTIASTEGVENETTQPKLSSEKVQREVGLASGSIKPRPALTKLELPIVSKSLPVKVSNPVDQGAPVALSPAPGALSPAPANVENESKNRSTSLRLHGLLLALQRTRAFVNPERRPNKVVMIQRRPGILPYNTVSNEANLRTVC